MQKIFMETTNKKSGKKDGGCALIHSKQENIRIQHKTCASLRYIADHSRNSITK